MTKREKSSGTQTKYKYSPIPFGPGGLFIGFILFFGLVTLIAEILGEKMGLETNIITAMLVVVGVFVMIVLAVSPYLINDIPTPFEKTRKPLKNVGARKGGRVLIYKDGIEIRNIHAFFIPYDRMDEIRLEKALLSEEIVIRTDLAELPGTIRFDCEDIESVYSMIKADSEDIGHAPTELAKDEAESKRESRHMKIGVGIAIGQIVTFVLFGLTVGLEKQGVIFFAYMALIFCAKVAATIEKEFIIYSFLIFNTTIVLVIVYFIITMIFL